MPNTDPRLSRLDLPRILEAIRELYRTIEHPPGNDWQAPAWLIAHCDSTTAPWKQFPPGFRPGHSWLIHMAAEEVLWRLSPPFGGGTCAITDSQLDLPVKAALLDLARLLQGHFLGQMLASDAGERVQALDAIENLMVRLGGDRQAAGGGNMLADPVQVALDSCRLPDPAPMPQNVLRIAEPIFRQRATDAWTAASKLRRLMELWEAWLHQLETSGDADPGLAMQMSEAVAVCVRSLCALRTNMPTFNGAEPQALLQRFPSQPSHSRRPPWQEDQLYRLRIKELLGRREWGRLQAELLGFLQQLDTAPGVALPTTAETATPPILIATGAVRGAAPGNSPPSPDGPPIVGVPTGPADTVNGGTVGSEAATRAADPNTHADPATPDPLDTLFAADKADRQQKEAARRTAEEAARRRQQVLEENETVRELLHVASWHALAYVLALRGNDRADTPQLVFYRGIAANLGDKLPKDQTPATVAAAILAAGQAVDRARGPGRLDNIPTPGTPENEHFRPLRFLVALLRLGREGKTDEIARNLVRLSESPALQQFLFWFAPVADRLCNFELIDGWYSLPAELPLPPGRHDLEAYQEVARALGWQHTPIGPSASSAAIGGAENPVGPSTARPTAEASPGLADAGDSGTAGTSNEVDGDARRTATAKQPIPADEANVLVRRFIAPREKVGLKVSARDVSRNCSIALGRVPSMPAWIAYQARRAPSGRPTKPRTHRPLTDQQLAAIGKEDDPSAELITAEERAWRHLIENARSDDERARLYALTAREKAEAIRLALDQLQDASKDDDNWRK